MDDPCSRVCFRWMIHVLRPLKHITLKILETIVQVSEPTYDITWNIFGLMASALLKSCIPLDKCCFILATPLWYRA